jgi:branched-chain amino acid transport system permease protein
MSQFLQFFLSGLGLGAVIALLALGFVIIFKATEVVNFAHGALLIAGVYVAARARELYKWSFPLAMTAGILAAAVMGLIIERLLVSTMRARRADVIAIGIMTIGVEILMRTEVNRRLGTKVLSMGDPWGAKSVKIGSIIVPQTRVAALVLGGLILGAFFTWFKFSNWGVAMRAAAEDAQATALMGIRLSRVSAVAWVIAGVLAAIAGLFLCAYPTPGFDANASRLALAAFPAAILGGLDSAGGALAGGLIVGLADQLANGYQKDLTFLGDGVSAVVPFFVMLIVLLIRPSGLFGTKEVGRV